MKKTLLIAAALSVLSLPVFAQSTPSGTSAGGPARVGQPGEIGGGVPGTKPGVSPVGREMTRPAMRRPMMKRKAMKRKKRSRMM